MSDTNQIAVQVLEARESIIDRMFAGPEGEELIRLDAAYRALTGSEPPSVGAVLAKRNGKALTKIVGEQVAISESWQTEKSDDDGDWIELVRRGPKDACRELMQTGPDREWTYDDLEAHFKEVGIVIDAQNPRDAIRTAMASLTREGLAKKVGKGTFRPVRDFPTDAPEGGEQTNQSVGEWYGEGSH